MHSEKNLIAIHEILWIQSGSMKSRGKWEILPLESGIHRHPKPRMVLQALGDDRDVSEREIVNLAPTVTVVKPRDLMLRQQKEGE